MNDPNAASVWNREILALHYHSKHAVFSGDFTMLRQYQAIKTASILSTPLSGVSQKTIDELKQLAIDDIEHVLALMRAYAQVAESLKGDLNPTVETWQARLQMGMDEAEKSANTHMELKIQAVITVIERLPQFRRESAANIWIQIQNIVMNVRETMAEQMKDVVFSVRSFIKGRLDELTRAFDKVETATKSARIFIEENFKFGYAEVAWSAGNEASNGLRPWKQEGFYSGSEYTGCLDWPLEANISGVMFGLARLCRRIMTVYPDVGWRGVSITVRADEESLERLKTQTNIRWKDGMPSITRNSTVTLGDIWNDCLRDVWKDVTLDSAPLDS